LERRGKRELVKEEELRKGLSKWGGISTYFGWIPISQRKASWAHKDATWITRFGASIGPHLK